MIILSIRTELYPENIMKNSIIIALSLLVSACATPRNPPHTVSQVNLPRYMGTWYEIASFPNAFQGGCQCTTAHYQLKDNQVSILNQCYKGQDYHLSSAKGTAWVVPHSHNSKLRVQFFWPFKGDYWILYLSKHYQQVIVGSPNRQYLWILSRTRTISRQRYQHLVHIAKQKGFATNQLRRTYQGCPKAI